MKIKEKNIILFFLKWVRIGANKNDNSVLLPLFVDYDTLRHIIIPFPGFPNMRNFVALKKWNQNLRKHNKRSHYHRKLQY